MRDPKRIQPIINDLSTYWHQHPDLRFWQIVEIMKDVLIEDECFYIEDQKTAEALKKMIK